MAVEGHLVAWSVVEDFDVVEQDRLPLSACEVLDRSPDVADLRLQHRPEHFHRDIVSIATLSNASPTLP